MPKLFISYRRKSWAFTHRLADDLRERLNADIFVDVDSIDQTDFEKAIVKHLHQSDAALLVISETTFADRIHRDDDWVRREIREALERKIPLVLVCVEGLLPPSGLPDDIRDVARMQGVNFYPEYFTPGVEKLADFITRIAPIQRKTALSHSAPSPSDAPTERPIAGKTTLDEALALMEGEDFGKAIFLLENLRATGYTNRYVSLDELLKTADEHQQAAERRRQAQLEYDDIAPLAKSPITRLQGMKAFEAWCRDYPDLVAQLDIEKLSYQFHPSLMSRELMPAPFEWVDIPAGKVTLITEKGRAKNYIPEGEQQTFPVEAFKIAKYPITNTQFELFLKANGYKNKAWWTADGWQVKEEKGWKEPNYWQDKGWNKPDYPVVGVSWYEAVAFCLWLSEATDEKILLPSEQEWQRVAQGDKGWVYPWGNAFDKSRCNLNDQGTTPVTQYPKGASPYGVMDMSGNVWEWCSTAYETGSTDLGGTDVRRVVRGGSFDDARDFARAAFRNYYHPAARDFRFGFRVVCRPPSFGL